MARIGDNPCLVRFFFMNKIVRWDLTPGDFGFASADVACARKIHVLWFGWLFLVAELEYCSNQWEEPCWLSGVVNVRLLAEARSWERWMDYVSHRRVICGQEIQCVSQLVGTPVGNMHGRRYIEEVVLAQLEILVQSPDREFLKWFSRQLDASNVPLFGQWLCFGFFHMLSITLSGELLAPDVLDYQIGTFLIVICVVNMITREFCYTRDDGYVDAIDTPYHSDLMNICFRQHVW